MNIGLLSYQVYKKALFSLVKNRGVLNGLSSLVAASSLKGPNSLFNSSNSCGGVPQSGLPLEKQAEEYCII